MKTEPDPDELSERAAEARARLDTLASELDQRRHLVTRARALATENPLLVLGGALAAVGLTAGVTALAIARSRRHGRLSSRARRVARALSRAAAQPERVARKEPTLGGKLLTAVAITAATTVVKRLAEQLLPALTRVRR
jgi:hypothetical protein